jgi:hypothetical protein
VEEHVGIGWIVGNRSANDRDRATPRSTFPATQVDRLRAGQWAETHLDATDDEERLTRPAGEAEPLDAPLGDGEGLDPGRLGHRRIVAC